MAGSIPFTVNIPQATLDRILNQVRDMQFPERIGSGWDFGINYDFMQELVQYWIDRYDWRRFERELNQHPQFLSDINNKTVHFYHIIGQGEYPTPLLLTHGWPGSVIEYIGIIDRLTNPAKFGGDSKDAFTVVIPSLPGYGFSFKPDEPFGPVKTAELWKQLMVDVLGYKRFASHAGDLGGLVQVQLAHRYPQHLIGVHFLNIATNPIPETEMNEEEKAWAAQANAFFQAEMSYFPQQMIKPATVAFALADNPVRAAAWALEKIYAWSDHRGYFEELFSKERLLDMVMVYLVTQTAGSAMAFYGGIPRETQWMLHPGEKIAVPTAVANFPADYLNAHPPRSLAERFYNIIQWNSFERGGHFPGLEVPEDLVADLKTFFHQLQS